MNTSPETQKSSTLPFSERMLVMVLVWAFMAYVGFFESEKELAKSLAFYSILGGIYVPPVERFFKDTAFTVRFVLACVALSAVLDIIFGQIYPG